MAKLSRSIRREIEKLVRTKGMSYQDAAIYVARGRAHKARAALHRPADARYPRTELRLSQDDLAQIEGWLRESVRVVAHVRERTARERLGLDTDTENVRHVAALGISKTNPTADGGSW